MRKAGENTRKDGKSYQTTKPAKEGRKEKGKGTRPYNIGYCPLFKPWVIALGLNSKPWCVGYDPWSKPTRKRTTCPHSMILNESFTSCYGQILSIVKIVP